MKNTKIKEKQVKKSNHLNNQREERHNSNKNKQKLLNYQDYLKKLKNFVINLQSNRRIKKEFANFKQSLQLNDLKQVRKNGQINRQSNQKTFLQPKNNQQQREIHQVYAQTPQLSQVQQIQNKSSAQENLKNKEQINQLYDFDSLLCLDEDIQSLMICKYNNISDIKKTKIQHFNYYFQENTKKTSKITQLTMPSIQQRIFSEENQQQQKSIHTHKKHRSMHNKTAQTDYFKQTLQTYNKKKLKKESNDIKTNPFNIQNFSINIQGMGQNASSKNKPPKFQIDVKQILNKTRKESSLSKTSRQSYQTKKTKLRKS